MLHALVLLAQIVSAQPSLPPADVEAGLVTVTMKLDDEREMTLTKTADGRPVRAIIRRYDGKRMTCDPYFAWVSQEFTCNGDCGWSSGAYGTGGGTSRSAACAAARAEMCSQATCGGGGTYQFCSMIESESGVYYDAGGVCGYTSFHTCFIDQTCP